METKSTQKFTMFLKVKDLLAENQKVWVNVKEIEKAVKKFNKNIVGMKELSAGTRMDLKGIDEKKDKARNALISEAIPVINIIRAYAIEHKNKSLDKKCDIKKQKLVKMKSGKLLDYCKKMIKEARKLYNKSILLTDKEDAKATEKSSILNYGLSVPMIENLKEVNQAFWEICAIYDEARAEKKKFICKFKSLVNCSEKLLSNKLDLLLSMFESGNSEFYTKYRMARKTEKTVTTQNKKKTDPELKKEAPVTVKKPANKPPARTVKTAVKPAVRSQQIKTPVIPGVKKPVPPKPKTKTEIKPEEEKKA